MGIINPIREKIIFFIKILKFLLFKKNKKYIEIEILTKVGFKSIVKEIKKLIVKKVILDLFLKNKDNVNICKKKI